MALLLQHQEANQLRGNLSAFFVFSSIISLMVQWPTGFLTWHHVLLTLPLIPAAWLGYVLARKTTHSLPKEKTSLCGAGALFGEWCDCGVAWIFLIIHFLFMVAALALGA